MSHLEVAEKTTALINETKELYSVLKQETEALKKNDNARVSELKDVLERVTKALDIAEEAKAAAEKAEHAAKALRAVEPILHNAKKSDIEELYEKKLSPEEFDKYKEHKRLFKQFIIKGDQFFTEKEADFMKMRTKDLTGVSDPNGGYVVIPEMDAAITRVIYETSPMRQVCTVKTITTDQYEKLQRVDLPTAVWTDRLSAPGTTTTPTYNKLIIRANNVAAEPLIHQFLLDDAAVDVENELVLALAKIFELTENSAFVSGDGAGQPTGFLSYAAGSGYDTTVASIVANWGKIEQVVAGSTSAVQYDGLVNLQTALKEPYHNNASWVMNRPTRGAVRLLKNGNGDPMWAPGLAGAPSELFGYPVVVAADMPSITSNSLSIAFGDFGMGYTIVDRMGTRLLRDPYTQKPYVKYYTTKRTGGGVDNFEAIKLQKFAAS